MHHRLGWPRIEARRTTDDRFPTAAVAVSMIVALALRARFVGTPITTDEGGYLEVARAWASGQGLYAAAWVDRPQGLLVLYRMWDALTGGSTEAIRAMAIVFGSLAVAGVAYAVFAVGGRRAAAVAALLAAVASANARIEGFIANGELLAGGVAAAGVATGCAYLFRGRGVGWLFASGVLGGCAISLKQSGFDGLLAVMVCIVAGALTGERRWGQVLREWLVCAAGLSCVLAALLVHGIVVGFSRWWYAVAGYRLGGINTTTADWHRFGVTSQIAAPTIAPLLIAAVVGLLVWVAGTRRISRSSVLVPAWLCFSAAAFLTGGLFHRHYWVTLTFPLAAAAGIALAKLDGRLLVVATSLVVIPSLISTQRVLVLDRSAAAEIASDDSRLSTNEEIGEWFKQHRTPSSTLYAMCASAALYVNADTISPYPYLWFDGVLHGRGAQAQLVALFTGPRPPTFVATFSDPRGCEPTGQVDRVLKERYIMAATIGGVPILVLRTV